MLNLTDMLLSRDAFFEQILEPAFARLNKVLKDVSKPDDVYVYLNVTAQPLTETELQMVEHDPDNNECECGCRASSADGAAKSA
jgi:hypothetical protein